MPGAFILLKSEIEAAARNAVDFRRSVMAHEIQSSDPAFIYGFSAGRAFQLLEFRAGGARKLGMPVLQVKSHPNHHGIRCQ